MLAFKKWRRRRISQKAFPEPWLKIIEENVPFYKNLPDEDKKELQRHILIFISEKYFEGCGGLKITDQIKVTIATQACILLLHRKTDYYPGLSSILVHPQAYVAHMTEHLPGGVVTEGLDVRLGESWHRGSVVLSWDDVRCGAADIHDGHNVVFHEFAHQLEDSGARGDSTLAFRNRSGYIYPYPLSRQKTGAFKVDSSPYVKAVGTEGARRATGVPTATPYTLAGLR